MEQLLDPNSFSIELLQNVYSKLLSGNEQECKLASDTLSAFVQSPSSVSFIQQITSQTSSLELQFIAIQIIQYNIENRWASMDEPSRNNYKTFIESLISNFLPYPNASGVVRKLNVALVTLLKKSWPFSYPDYFVELLSSNRKDVAALTNSLSIFTMFAEEVFEYHKDSLTSEEKKVLSSALGTQVQPVVDLVFEILSCDNPNSNLLFSCLGCLNQIVSWIPIQYIFAIHKELHVNLPWLIVDSQISWSTSELANISLSTLAKIVNSTMNSNNSDVATFTYIFLKVIQRMQPIYGDPNFLEMYQYDDVMLQLNVSFVSFVNSFLTYHSACLYAITPPSSLGFSSGDLKKSLHLALASICVLSKLQDDAIYKTTRDFWTMFSKRFKQTRAMNSSSNFEIIVRTLEPCFEEARVTLIQLIGRPKEVLVITEETGYMYEETRSDTLYANRYTMTKEALCALCALDSRATVLLMSTLVKRVCESPSLSHPELNSCTWAIGAIAPALNDDSQRSCICEVLQPLLKRCASATNKADRAIMASSIMYITSQYPRFLKSHWAFFKVVINKLLEFLSEDFPGVRQMSVETLLSLFQSAPGPLVAVDGATSSMYIETILSQLDRHVSYLDNPQSCVLYRAIAHVISHAPIIQRQALISSLMLIPNHRFTTATTSLLNGISVDALTELISVLRINSCVFFELRDSASNQLSTIWPLSAEMFNLVSKSYNQLFNTNNREELKYLKAVKIAIMEVLGAYVGGDVRGIDMPPQRHKDEILSINNIGVIQSKVISKSAKEELMESVIPSFFNSVISQFSEVPDQGKDAQTLILAASIIEALDSVSEPLVVPAFEKLFSPVWQLFATYPNLQGELLLPLIKLILSFCAFCPSAMANMPFQATKFTFTSLNSIISHHDPEVSSTAALALCYLYSALLNMRVFHDPVLISQLFSQVLVETLSSTLVTLTDKMHSANNDMYWMILCLLSEALRFTDASGDINTAVKIFESSEILVPFNIPHQYTNVDAVCEWLTHIISSSLSFVPSNVSANFVSTFKTATPSSNDFKQALNDFVIKAKQSTY